MQKQIRVFISYSWDSEEHKHWVRKLAESLDSYKEIEVIWDGFDLDVFADKNLYMERSIHEATHIIIVTTKKYKEKADQRKGGVGIETYLGTALHWNESDAGGSSGIVVAQRENDSIPRYLQGKLHIDFSNDESFTLKLGELIQALKGTSKISRPPKLLSLDASNLTYTFTRAEDILRVNHSKRVPIIVGSAGTDFSAGNRIKFELWATYSPRVEHFLFLFNNITISHTIKRFCEEIQRQKISLKALTILRPEKGDEGLVDKLFSEFGLKCEFTELTYSAYIWNYLIDEDLKNTGTVYQLPFYTDQAAAYIASEGQRVEYDSAITLLHGALERNQGSAAHLLIAPGGMGKTTLCHELVNQIQKSGKSEVGVVFMQAESLRHNLPVDVVASLEINSVYDLYEFYSRINGFDSIYGKAAFELSVLCGKLFVVIDGLDELVSVFQERFHIHEFLSSIKALHDQMGSSKVLLTSRSSPFIDALGRLVEYQIQSYELLGFTEDSCRKYSRKRFAKYSDASVILERLNHSVSELANYDDNRRVIPFFIDVVATIFEEQFRDKQPISFALSTEQRGYESNDRLVDLIVFSVFRREKERHSIDISIKELVELLAELVAESDKFVSGLILQERLSIFYDERGKSLYQKILLNPLLIGDPGGIRFRYDFLNDYFTVIYLIQAILQKQNSELFFQCLARQTLTNGSCLRDLQAYFAQRKQLLHDCVKRIIADAKHRLAENKGGAGGAEVTKRAVGALLRLYAGVHQSSREMLTSCVRDLYGIDPRLDVPGKIDGLYIYGDFPSLDFSGLEIWHSKLSKYLNFLSSKFANTKFIYCEFDGVNNDRVSDSFSPTIFDSTCSIGDLGEVIKGFESNAKSERELLEAELKKFFRVFYKNSMFRDKTIDYIRFSTRVSGLNQRNFDKLIKCGLIQLSPKINAKYYEISPSFRPSVYQYLNNNFADKNIADVLSIIS